MTYIPKCNGTNMMWQPASAGKMVECPSCHAQVRLKKGGQFRKHIPRA